MLERMAMPSDRMLEVRKRIHETISEIAEGKMGRADAMAANRAIQTEINEIERLLWAQGRETSDTDEEIAVRIDQFRELHYALQKAIQTARRENLKRYLIGEALMELLKLGQGSPLKAWIIFHDDHPQVIFNAPTLPSEDTFGGQEIPRHALQNGQLLASAKYEIIDYLQKSFVLPESDAEEVYLKVSQAQPAP